MSVVEVAEVKNEIIQPQEPTVEKPKRGRPKKVVGPKEPKVIPTVTKVDVKEVVLKEEKLPKPKRELSEKQKEAFKKGQEALKLYRQKQKEAKEAKRQEVLDKKIEEVKSVSPDAKIIVKKIQQRRKKSDPAPPPKPKKAPIGRPRRFVEETSATSATDTDAQTTDYPSDTESESESDSGVDKKYVRKAVRRINAVKKIEETIQRHSNPYHNMSVF
ncbi:MAG: hypothetical protein NT055_02100 [Nitrospirae bacterium]|nr:hypothetical protein [Nitrospirota bacterium]